MKRNNYKTVQRTGARRRRFEKMVIRGIDSFVDWTVLVLFCLLFFYSCYALWDTGQIYEVSAAEQYEIYKPTEEESISFEELVEINPDVFGWITVYGTNIDYPLVQTDNNETYVNTNAKGEYALSGSIFLDYRNARNFSDFNSIVYGHHMEKHAMFGEIAEFEDEDYFNSHRYGSLYVDGREYGLEFFTFLYADGYDGTIYVPGRTVRESQEAYLERLRELSIQWREVGVSVRDRLILLSTCRSEDASARQILVGRICEEVFPNTLDQETVREQRSVDAYSWRENFGRVPLLVWSAGLLFGLVLIAVGYDRWRKRKCADQKKHIKRSKKKRAGKNADEDEKWN